MATYSDLLKDPRWQKKRLEILQRDNFCCKICFDNTNTLHVHHKYYEKGFMPWDYENKFMVTLCERCHELEGLKITELKNTVANLLLRSEFYADEILEIVKSITDTECGHLSDVVANAYSFAFRDKDTQQFIIDSYFESLKETSHAQA